MTADAKVGLLLGLVFIVIIAFLVNGLPNYFKRSEIEVISQDVAVPLPNRIIAPPLEDYIPSVKLTVKPREVSPPTGEEKIEVTIAAVETPVKSKVVASNPKPKVKTYEVQDLDTLSSILEKVYGSGDKQYTVELIAKANDLDSPDLIYVGQVLKMPDLSVSASKKGKGPTLVGNIAEFIKKVTQKKPEAKKVVVKKPEVKKPVKPKSREYKVKAGECLSEIASEQCGTIRYVDAIVKLNKLDDADDIFEGMVLKLPRVQSSKRS
jgi:nucleoid-associated protein YgaU